MSRFLRACEGPCSIAIVAVFVAVVLGLSIAARTLLAGDLNRAQGVRGAQLALSDALRPRADALTIADRPAGERFDASVRALGDPAMTAQADRIAHGTAGGPEILALMTHLRSSQAALDAATQGEVARIVVAQVVLGFIAGGLAVGAMTLRTVVRRQREELERVRRLAELRSIAEVVDDLHWTATPDGTLDFASPKWAAYAGIERAALVARGWQHAVHPADRGAIATEWRRAVDAGEEFEAEHRIRDAGGAYQWFRTRAVPFRDGGGAVVGWFGFSTNIDAGRRREEARERAQARERQVLAHLRSALSAPALPDVPFITFDAARVGGSDADVSSQWYEAVMLPDDRIFVCLGRGVGERGPEALDAIDLARRSIIAAAPEETCPRTVLARANTVMLLRRGGAIAALCGYFDPARQHFTYATAGHDAPFIADRFGTRRLGDGGVPLGVFAGAEFAKHEISIADALLVLLNVDGDEATVRGRGDAGTLDAVRAASSVPHPARSIGEAVRDRAHGAEAVVVTARGVRGGEAAVEASA